MRVNVILGNDTGAWCAYHCMKGHHTEDYHHLKREIETLIQRGRLLAYVKDLEGSTGKGSPFRKEPDSENTSTKVGKNTEEIRETRVVRHTLNTISGGFAGGGEISMTRKRYV